MRRALTAGVVDAAWLGEQLHALMQRLLQVQHHVYREVARLPAARAATREELYRRLHLAKEYAESAFDTALTLDDLAREAGLSPNHLLRMFEQAFGQTPHQYLTAKRLEHARHLLTHTD
jgi:AraC family transcriptional regulator